MHHHLDYRLILLSFFPFFSFLSSEFQTFRFKLIKLFLEHYLANRFDLVFLIDPYFIPIPLFS